MAPAKRRPPTLRYGDLDRGHVTKHLLLLARRVGVENVTMRGLAAEAGTAASSVYYHVKDKGQMFDLLIDTVMRDVDVPEDGDWEERLVGLYTSAWDNLVSVPGIAALLHQRPITPATAELDRATRQILSESPIPKADLETAHAVLYINLLGSVEFEHRLQKRWNWESTDLKPTQSVFEYGLRNLLAGMTGAARGRRTMPRTSRTPK